MQEETGRVAGGGEVMNESAGIPGDPLGGQSIAGRWSFGYDMPDELGGGFVAGELLLRGDGVLLRRYGGSSYRAGQVTWKYGPWDAVSWWAGETDPLRTVALLKSRGYDLLRHDPVPVYKPATGPCPARRPPGSHCDARLHHRAAAGCDQKKILRRP
jgi:hypothetical protein